jgi:hypothetical protein
MINEWDENLALFFGRFLNTLEEMDAHLGFKATHYSAPRLLEA